MTPQTTCVLAAAQTASVRNDVAANMVTHLRAVRTAAGLGVQLLVFPELSLTGYEHDCATELAFVPDDVRLGPLRDAAVDCGMVLVAGGPLHASCIVQEGRDAGKDSASMRRPCLGSIIALPDGSVRYYAKMHLHGKEQDVFAAGSEPMVLPVSGETVGLAICADTCAPAHPQYYADKGAGVYAAGVMISKGGYAADAALFAGYARQHAMLTLMANHCVPTGGWDPAGRSGIWLPDGRHLCASDSGEALVLARRCAAGWALETAPL